MGCLVINYTRVFRHGATCQIVYATFLNLLIQINLCPW
jgi:hypothetical protein